jgi:hypothetical protein
VREPADEVPGLLEQLRRLRRDLHERHTGQPGEQAQPVRSSRALDPHEPLARARGLHPRDAQLRVALRDPVERRVLALEHLALLRRARELEHEVALRRAQPPVLVALARQLEPVTREPVVLERQPRRRLLREARPRIALPVSRSLSRSSRVHRRIIPWVDLRPGRRNGHPVALSRISSRRTS